MDPDRSGWDAIVGKYDYKIGEFRIEEIVRKDGELYAKAANSSRGYELRMYPLGENIFGIKDLDGDLSFDENGLSLYGQTGRKL